MWDLEAPDERSLFEGCRPDPGPDRPRIDAVLGLTLTIVLVLAVVIVCSVSLFHGPLSDAVALPGKIVSGFGS